MWVIVLTGQRSRATDNEKLISCVESALNVREAHPWHGTAREWVNFHLEFQSGDVTRQFRKPGLHICVKISEILQSCSVSLTVALCPRCFYLKNMFSSVFLMLFFYSALLSCSFAALSHRLNKIMDHTFCLLCFACLDKLSDTLFAMLSYVFSMRSYVLSHNTLPYRLLDE